MAEERSKLRRLVGSRDPRRSQWELRVSVKEWEYGIVVVSIVDISVCDEGGVVEEHQRRG